MSEFQCTPTPMNPVRLRNGSTIEMRISKGQIVVLDASSLPRVSGHRWFAQESPSGFYAVTRVGPGRVSMQRLLIAAPEGLVVDHIDGDTLNNTLANLRIATRQQNAMNRRTSSTNRSSFKGVTWKNRKRPWQATIKTNGKKKYLGSFASPVEAALAYDAAARQAFGAFASLNFPREGERNAAIEGKVSTS